MTKLELVRRIKAVMDETGLHESDRKKLSRELDARGISPLKGGKWGENSSKLGNWWRDNKHLLALQDGSTQESTAYASGTQQPTSYDASIHENTELTVSHQNTGEHDIACETPAYASTHTSAPHSSIREHTEESVLQPYAIDTQVDAEHTSTQSPTEIVESVEPDVVPQETTLSHDPSGEMPAHNVIQMDPKDAADLAELLMWWRERRCQLDTMQITHEERPRFNRGQTDTKTVRLSSDMARAAEKYAAKHRSQTGGTFSRLCEWLLWQALGRPEKFVTQENTE